MGVVVGRVEVRGLVGGLVEELFWGVGRTLFAVWASLSNADVVPDLTIADPPRHFIPIPPCGRLPLASSCVGGNILFGDGVSAGGR